MKSNHWRQIYTGNQLQSINKLLLCGNNCTCQIGRYWDWEDVRKWQTLICGSECSKFTVFYYSIYNVHCRIDHDHIRKTLKSGKQRTMSFIVSITVFFVSVVHVNNNCSATNIPRAFQCFIGRETKQAELCWLKQLCLHDVEQCMYWNYQWVTVIFAQKPLAL